MHKILVMNELQTREDLVSDHKDSFEWELSITQFKIIFKGSTHQLRDNKIEVSILTMPQ